MTLTEQWKKGELPEGFYYVDDGAEVTIDYYFCDYWERHFDGYVQQVLAPVPSYKEWQELHKRLKDTQNLELEVRRENQQLKELLNYIRDEIADMPSTAMQRGFGWISEAAYRIDNAIGEK